MVKNPNYKEPSKEDIKRALERCGYEYYLPTNLLLDLIILSSYFFIDGSTEKALTYKVNPDNEFEVKKYEFYASLNLDLYPGLNPLEKAIFTLKGLSKIIDFRRFENRGLSFQRKVSNFKKELSEVERIYFNEFDDINQHDLAQIVSLSMFLEDNIKVGNKKQESELTLQKMDKPTEFLRTAKTNLVKPDFKLKLLKRNLRVFKTQKPISEEKALIFLEDVTNSMTQNKGYLISQAVKSLLIQDNRIVHHYQFAGDYITYEKLEKKEDKIKKFTTPNTYFDRRNNYTLLIDYINSQHKNGNVLLASDGNDYVSYKPTNLKYFYIGTVHNQDMKNFIKQTRGKYLLL